MPSHVVLLRGVNVGGHNRLKMGDLREVLGANGFDAVSTLLQSGNVLLESNLNSEKLAAAIEDTVGSEFGFTPKAIVRSKGEVGDMIDGHPFSDDHLSEPRFAHVVFCADTPDDSDFDELREIHDGSEEMWLSGKELFVYYTDGSGRSKLTNTMLEKHLNTQVTSRNWNTVLKIADGLAEAG